jgi:antitoxin component HigA of HigAB toxin-antitoxin module
MLTPHYINQNFIIDVLMDKEKGIEDIEIVNKVFPPDPSNEEKINLGLAQLKNDLRNLMDAVKTIEKCEKDLSRIPVFTRLITTEIVKKNIFSIFLPKLNQINKYDYNEGQYKKHITSLNEIQKYINNNPFIDSLNEEFRRIKEALKKAYDISKFEQTIRDTILACKSSYDAFLETENKELKKKSENAQKLADTITLYISNLMSFKATLENISHYKMGAC